MGFASIAMNEDHPSPQPARSWLERISQLVSGEPRNIDELLEELRGAQANGLLSDDTLSMVEGAIEVADLIVADVMLPRAQMVCLPADAPLAEIVRRVIDSGHSRFPVHGDDPDQIIGILLAKDLLKCFVEGSAPCNIRTLLRPVAMIPESKRLNILLKEFRLSRNHMAIVVDEYGGLAGLVAGFAAILSQLGPPLGPLVHDPNSYDVSQQVGLYLRSRGSDAIVYRSVRRTNGTCTGLLRPRAVRGCRRAGVRIRVKGSRSAGNSD